MSVRVRLPEGELALSWEEWEERVAAGRIPPLTPIRFEPVTGPAWRPARELEMYTSLHDEAMISWRSRFTDGPPPVITALLVGVQVRFWWAARLPRVEDFAVTGLTNWAPPIMEDGEVWRMLTMGLVHTGTFHLVINMLWLGYTSWNLERALGWRNALFLFSASVLGGSALSLLGSPETPSLGASGGVFGLIAASVVFGLTRPELLPERGRRLFGVALLPYLALMFLSGLSSATTDNWAHLGGLITGGLLMLALDPEPLQRRPGWNRMVRGSLTGTAAAGLLTLALAGPRIDPLLPAANTPALARYSVPWGWRVDPNNPTGWSSALHPRTWRVSASEEGSRATAEDLAGRWLSDRLRHAPDGRLLARGETSLDGRQALRLVFEDDARTWTWVGAARGRLTLETTWSAELGAGHRQERIHQRLLQQVRWLDPLVLESAQAHLERSPDHLHARIELAEGLTAVGRYEEAAAQWGALCAERPEEPAVWLAVLAWAHDLPPEVLPRAPLWRDALANSPTPARVAAMAKMMDDEGEEQLAAGLLQVAWAHWPGDRELKGARRSRGLSIRLEGSRPWEEVRDPLTGGLRASPGEPPMLDLEAARRAGEDGAALRQAVIDRLLTLDPSDPTVTPLLFVLRQGAPPADLDRGQSGLERDLYQARQGQPPDWLPAQLAAHLAGAEDPR
ncbi:MAG: rhomboid family intramembrane serine protease [Deltaproteobacteria bacterium]|nr:rhomboid family intramembrane serine protease [Deltaproteobacteria bacterium]